jgi:hypothetical protein
MLMLGLPARTSPTDVIPECLRAFAAFCHDIV